MRKEKPPGAKRAVPAEKPMSQERARIDENPKGDERANEEEQPVGGEREASPLAFLVNSHLEVQKLRVAAQVRSSHLKLRKRHDPVVEQVRDRALVLEEFIEGEIARLITDHPAWPWLKGVKGVGKENVAKIIGLVDIERADTISSLWSFAGYAPVDGHSMRRVKGQKAPFNNTLRMLCWRLGSSLLRAQGAFYQYYLEQKAFYERREQARGRKIVPATELPKVDGKRVETDQFISEGHIHLMALRKMIKTFLACLWLKWREGAGLPTRSPYAIEKLGHVTLIRPEEFVER